MAVWFVLIWAIAAYLFIPMLWELYFHGRKQLAGVPEVTTTTVGLPGDPLNVALIGSKEDITAAMHTAGWTPADPLGLKSDIRIAADTVLDRPYTAAPVSSLYLFGRKEDLAFEKPIGGSPGHRNHVRLWKGPEPDESGRPFWVGAATYDKSVGLSHTTGEVTHHIAPDVDTERARLMDDLKAAGDIEQVEIEKGFHKILMGKNGGGDPWRTDGDLWIGVLKPAGVAPTALEAPAKPKSE